MRWQRLHELITKVNDFRKMTKLPPPNRHVLACSSEKGHFDHSLISELWGRYKKIKVKFYVKVYYEHYLKHFFEIYLQKTYFAVLSLLLPFPRRTHSVSNSLTFSWSPGNHINSWCQILACHQTRFQFSLLVLTVQGNRNPKVSSLETRIKFAVFFGREMGLYFEA